MSNILLIATGSVAAIRSGILAEEIQAKGHNVRLVHTAAATNFLEIERKLPSWLEVYNDEGEWRAWKKLGDPVQHIDLRFVSFRFHLPGVRIVTNIFSQKLGIHSNHCTFRCEYIS